MDENFSLTDGHCPHGDCYGDKFIAQGKDLNSLHKHAYEFVECSTHQHWHLKHWPSLEHFHFLYQNYQTNNSQHAYSPHRFIRKIKQFFFDRQRLKFLKNHSIKNILEIGAGDGETTLLLQSFFPQAKLHALDLVFSSTVREKLQAHNIQVHEKLWEKTHFLEKFDLIVAVHFIEHIHHPQVFLRWCRDHLNEGGLLYLETPDTAAIAQRFFPQSWGMYHYPFHTHLFSRASLAQLVSESGLVKVEHKALTSAAAWIMSCREALGFSPNKKGPWWSDFFHYSNPLLLGLFTVLDLILIFFKIPTSSQCFIAKK